MPSHPPPSEPGKRLRRLAALLCALADLAERAAGRSPVLCWLVLWLIRPSEAVAWDYVGRIVRLPLRLPEPLAPLDGPAEALRLAQSFRALAAVLTVLAQHVGTLRLAACAPSTGQAATAAGPFPARSAAIARLDTS